VKAILTPDDVEKVCKLYEEGKSIRWLAEECQYSYSGMRDLLLRNDVKLRRWGTNQMQRSTRSGR
jgi:hypothetical protein